MRDPAACAAEQQRLFTMFTAVFDDRLLAGREAILGYLRQIGVRRSVGQGAHG
jgi:hypothetical protein